MVKAVSTFDGIRYGFQLMIYLIGVAVVGVIVMGVGGVLIEAEQELVGGTLAIFGFLVVYAGFMGILYKIIADGVATGVLAARRS